MSKEEERTRKRRRRKINNATMGFQIFSTIIIATIFPHPMALKGTDPVLTGIEIQLLYTVGRPSPEIFEQLDRKAHILKTHKEYTFNSRQKGKALIAPIASPHISEQRAFRIK